MRQLKKLNKYIEFDSEVEVNINIYIYIYDLSGNVLYFTLIIYF